VPSWAKSGRVRLARKRGRKSNGAGPITIKRPVVNRPKAAGGGALAASGMWIWYVSKSNGGDPAAIAAQAKSHGVQTVFVKSSDGTTWWSQFSPALVSALKAGGLHVCAWQFVYGTSPAGEAALGARAAQTGADCLVIDAESKYEGKYGQAQTYINALRAAIGPDYPLALSGFPYVDFHPAFPYSVFLGPGELSTTFRRCTGRRSGPASTRPSRTRMPGTRHTSAPCSRWVSSTAIRRLRRSSASGSWQTSTARAV
jgi:hypothetical protein